MNRLEKKLHETTLSITDKVLHFPCVASRATTEYPDYIWQNKTLFLPVADKSYAEIAENLYRALTGYDKSIIAMADDEVKTLYSVINTETYRRIRDRKGWDEI